jgi:hypothetical protein
LSDAAVADGTEELQGNSLFNALMPTALGFLVFSNERDTPRASKGVLRANVAPLPTHEASAEKWDDPLFSFQ